MDENPFEVPRADPISLTRPSRGRWLIWLFVFPAIIFVVVVMLLPFRRNVSEVAKRTQCKNNLKQIAFALHNYHDHYESLPPAFTVDNEGRPLHSWRTLILPYLEQASLYNSIDLARPWDDPVNAKAAATQVSQYVCPSGKLAPGTTTYVAIVGEGTCFPGSIPKSIKEITDGTSNTLLVCEVPINHAVHWMSPNDANTSTILGIARDSQLAHTGGFQAATADGAVTFVSASVSSEVLHALISASAGDELGEF